MRLRAGCTDSATENERLGGRGPSDSRTGGCVPPASPLLTPQQIGGRATAKKLRTEALLRYYSSPQRCRYCKKIIPVLDHQRVGEVKKRKFCNHSCASRYNNNRAGTGSVPAVGTCGLCKEEMENIKRASGGYRRRKFCDGCLPTVRARQAGKDKHIGDSTKAEVYARYAKPERARDVIQKHARRAYRKSGNGWACTECGYDIHVEVCHRRAVHSFPGTALIRDINAITNLAALCPNHHWEFDNGQLEMT